MTAFQQHKVDNQPLAFKSKSKVLVFDTPQVVNCFKVESDAVFLLSWFNW